MSVRLTFSMPLGALLLALGCGGKPTEPPAPTAPPAPTSAPPRDASPTTERTPEAPPTTAPAGEDAGPAAEGLGVDALAARATGRTLGPWDKVEGATWRAAATELAADDPRQATCRVAFEDDECPTPAACSCWIAGPELTGGRPPLVGAAIVGAVRMPAGRPLRETWSVVLDSGAGWVQGRVLLDLYEDLLGFYRDPTIGTLARVEAGGRPFVRVDVVDAADDPTDDGSARVAAIARATLCGVEDEGRTRCVELPLGAEIGPTRAALVKVWSRTLTLGEDGRVTLGAFDNPLGSDVSLLRPAGTYTLAALDEPVGAAPGRAAPPEPPDDEPSGPTLDAASPLFAVCAAHAKAQALSDGWQCRVERELAGGGGAIAEAAILRVSHFDLEAIDRRVLALRGLAGWALGPTIIDTSVSGVGGVSARGAVVEARLGVAGEQPLLVVRTRDTHSDSDLGVNVTTADTHERVTVCSAVGDAPACATITAALARVVEQVDPAGDKPPAEYGPVGATRWSRAVTVEPDGTVVIAPAQGRVEPMPVALDGRFPLATLLAAPTPGVAVWRAGP